MDSSPGAWITIDGKETKLFGSKMWTESELPKSDIEVDIEGGDIKGVVHENGLLIPGSDGKFVNVKMLSVNGKFIQASKFGGANGASSQDLQLNDEEMALIQPLKDIWERFTNFFLNMMT